MADILQFIYIIENSHYIIIKQYHDDTYELAQMNTHALILSSKPQMWFILYHMPTTKTH